MTASAIPVHTAKPADSERVIAVLGLAFCADPATRWAFRDPHQYWAVWPDFVRAFAGQAFAQGTAFYIGQYEAAALWLPRNIHPDEEALGALMERSVAPADQPDVFAVL